MSELEDLTKLFTRLGASDAREWAASQVEEGINQLGRYLFLRQAWRLVLDEDDDTWIQAETDWSDQNPGEPCSGIGPALKRVLQKGADPRDITDVVRVMQYKLLFHFCYLLEDPGELEPDAAHISWRLVQTDGEGEITDSIDALHESVLETDPTGREMRPRTVGPK